jgi:hypothetical protein
MKKTYMKKIFFLSFVCFFAIQHTDAQLLKKLKDKAQKALEPKKTDPPVVENNGNETNMPTSRNEKMGAYCQL